MTQKPAYADLEIRILEKQVLEKQDEGYPVEITLNSKQEFPRGHLNPDFLPWVPSASPTKDGERLFEWLFADDRLKTAWAEVRGQQPQRRIRLRIDALAPELHAIPWELLRDTSPGHFPQTLAADSATPFSRYPAGQWPPGEPISDRPLKVLVAIANPTDLKTYKLTPIFIETERRIIEDAFSDLTTGQVKRTFLEQPITLPRLEAELKQGYHVLHIVAHGMFNKKRREAVLFLADDDDNQVKRENEKKFAEMIDRQSQKPQLIFLASCQSASRDIADAFRGFAPKLINVGVPTVLAMQDVVPVETAREFTRTFYRQLFRHGQVDLASNEARAALLTGDFPGSSIPVLFSRLPDNQLLAQLTGDAAPVIETKYFEPETIYIPAGPFWMGSQAGEGVPTYETSQHEVTLRDHYRIGKYPVTNEQYAEFLRQTRRLVAPEAGWEGQTPPADKLNHPVAGVTWYDALAYCQWLSEQTGRQYSLPSEAQWEKAARGTDGRIHSWGDEWDASRCNHGSDQTTPVDAYPRGASPYGCYDMVGNVREWTSTLWGEKLRELDPKFYYPWDNDHRHREDLTASRHILRVYRGGGAADKVEQLRCSARNAYFPDKPGPPRKRHGFRVVLKL